ncbi:MULTISPECIES: GNAT family N-acetyltransferase [unclassified Sutcliffiella]|jgi:RimJ/RimL family protein N-acetyltransferase|uniref:GNAT family N-acetyltransferase n=1 Tax=unclassified Sutcliffiella TaxID=2837532 RepID=UPI0030D49A39
MNTFSRNAPQILETDRLILRAPFEKSDGATVNTAIRHSHNELKEWLPFAQSVPLLEETEKNLKQAYDDFINRKSFRYLIFNKNTLEFVGVVTLLSINWEVPKCEIGYWSDTRATGKGYMNEAVTSLKELGTNYFKFNRMEIKCESTNYKSRSIPEKLGFELEGILKNEDLSADGKKLTDTCIYAITK